MKKITDIFNNFLELRKSIAFILLAAIGLADIVFWICGFFSVIYPCHLDDKFFLQLFICDLTFLGFFIFRAYLWVRYLNFIHYISIILIIFIIEKAFKYKLKFNFLENSKFYKILWIICIISFILGSLILPFTKKFLYEF